MNSAQVFALLYMATVMAAGTKNKASEAVSDPCSEIQFDEQLAAYFENEVSAAKHQLEANKNVQRSWNLLQYLVMDNLKSKAAAALAAYGSVVNIREENTINAASQKLLAAAKLLRQRAANVSAAFQLQSGGEIKLGTPDIDNGAKSITQADAGCNYDAITKSVATARCDATQRKTDTITAAAMSAETLDTIQLLTPAYTTTIAIKASAYSKGTPASSHTTYTFNNCQDTGGSASATLGATHALGIHVKAVGTAPATEKTTLKPTSDNKCPDEDSQTELTPIKNLARAICLARQAKLTTPRPLSAVGYTELQKNEEFKAIASIFLTNGEGQLDPEKDKQQINELIKETYGPNDEHFRKSYVEALDNKKWEFKIIKNKIEGSVTELANGENAALALAYYASKMKTGCGKPSAHTPIISNEVEKCKEDTEKDKCTEDKDCEHKVKASPLWLAFFLF
ncbi:uncharacterized protein TEOVI_000426000 [Trypanosoma equiperdum]|uniref:Variant surface glycoprotein (VSG) n=1 Tax=Trypanosoma equiperdum TaxID=5694 RepID=A0A1G4IJM4_TRYEQ|nr:hypothetical protein TEOVI_000426000 [Trypanosoma equiperdum]